MALPVACGLLGLLALVGTSATRAQEVQPVAAERAIVRVVGVSGIRRVFREERITSYAPRMAHGSGVLVSPSLVATALHVAGTHDLLWVQLGGQHMARGATVVSVDAENDLALLRIEAVRAPTVAVSQYPRRIRAGAPLVVAGYPMGLAQRHPALAPAMLSRATNDGSLELAASLNRGNSGGPIFDSRKRLVGIVTHRGRLDRGIQGIARATPVVLLQGLLGELRRQRVPQVPADLRWVTNPLRRPLMTDIGVHPVIDALLIHDQWRRLVNVLRGHAVWTLHRLPIPAQEEVHQYELKIRRALTSAMSSDSPEIGRYRLGEIWLQMEHLISPPREVGEVSSLLRTEELSASGR